MKLFKNNQSGRSLLPNISFLSRIFQMRRTLLSKCCSNAKMFLSAVYKKSTQAKKYQADGLQCGRSMIEMLGVLAIIGVLSIGGIAGYSKAMFKYRFNKTMDMITTAINRVIELENSNIGDITISSAQQMLDYGIAPNCPDDVGHACPMPLGTISGEWSFYDHTPGGSFDFTFTQHQFESCVAFFNSKIYETVPDNWWKDESFIQIAAGSKSKFVYSKSGYENSKTQITTEDIIDACQICNGANNCIVSWWFGI